MKDPFGEHLSTVIRRRVIALGGVFEFESGSEALLELVDDACAGFEPHRLPGKAVRFKVRLALAQGPALKAGVEPPLMHTSGGAGVLCGIIDAANFAVVCPAARTALVVISSDLLRRFRYHARYELLEFAMFTLASRAQGLTPLHAGCVGLNGAGLLLLGDSGAGKSTLALLSQAQGLEFLAEDAVFVEPRSLLATGLANFAHLRKDTLRLVTDKTMARRIRESPTIRRRSGVAKYEIDLRQTGFTVAPAPQRVTGLVFVASRAARGGELLTPLRHADAMKRLTASQPYASGLKEWKAFTRSLRAVGAFELRRGEQPEAAAQALRRLLDWGIRPRRRHSRPPA